ncbi:MAG TPA: choice-of-anchor D domain-containing protein [Candidatus Binataceae bacterium]|nr:choice-of-anchor D domain-containing protein [Candidatus Binataceae bacterium]
MPSTLSARARWRGFLKLGAAISYAGLMMAGLFGSSALQAQPTPTATITMTATPVGAPTVASMLRVVPETLLFEGEVVLPPDGLASKKPKNVTLSVARNEPSAVTIELPLMVSDPNSPPGPAQFIIQSNSCSTIQPGGKCEIPIIFQPNGRRARRAMLLITSNAENGAQSVNLVGLGRQGVLSIHPRAIGFGTTRVGGAASSSKSITVTNRNPVQATIMGVSSSNPSAFPINNECPGTLQPSAQCTISASFMATRNGGNRAVVVISDNAAGPDSVALTGSGIGGPTVTRTPTPTRTPRPTAAPTPGLLPMRAFPVMH